MLAIVGTVKERFRPLHRQSHRHPISFCLDSSPTFMCSSDKSSRGSLKSFERSLSRGNLNFSYVKSLILDNFALRELVITTRLQTLLALLPSGDVRSAVPVDDAQISIVQSHILHFISMCVLEYIGVMALSSELLFLGWFEKSL